MSIQILAVSDVEVNVIYSPLVVERFKDIDLLIGCGDLPYYYLEYMISMLNRPLYFVNGNHAPSNQEEGNGGPRKQPWGGRNLHRRVARDESGLLLAGIEGCLNYNRGPYQYTQGEMFAMAFSLIPKLLLTRLLYGRFIDILVTHAPPWRIHDQDDLPHQGIKAFRWLIKIFQPIYHLHGHIHIYTQYTPTETQFEQTRVVNVYSYKRLEIKLPK